MQENKSGHFFSEPISVIKSRWRHNWKSAQVVSSHLVCDPTIRQPGFDLRRQQWKQKCGLWYVKTAIFCTCGSNNWETVEDRWVHAASGLASTELSFHSCNVLRDCRRGVPRANKKWRSGYVKMTIFCNCGTNNWETVVADTLNTPYLPNAKAYELHLRKSPY